jgi:hypothetical protein
MTIKNAFVSKVLRNVLLIDELMHFRILHIKIVFVYAEGFREK